MLLKPNQRIVMTGDSITDCGRTRPIGEGFFGGLGTGYPHLVNSLLWSMHPELCLRVTNTGISGETSRGMLARFAPDVLDLCPDVVTILIGINDVWRKFDASERSEAQIPFEEYGQNLKEMVRLAQKNGALVMLLSPFFMDGGKGDPMQLETQRYFAACKSAALETGATFVDLQAPIDAFLSHASAYKLSADRVHPTPIGHMLIARAVLGATGVK